MRTYNILFKMPEDKELFVAAYAAICAYEKGLRDLNYPVQLILIAKDSWLNTLIIPSITFVVESLEDIKNMNVDYAIDLSEDRAIDIGMAGRTAANAYAAIMGMDNKVSELVKVRLEMPIYDICIIHWSQESIKLSDRLSRKQLEVVNIGEDALDCDPKQIIDVVMKSQIVVGRRSVMTYLASCANRIVIEGYALEDYNKEFFSKWANPRYSMVCVEKKVDLDQNIHIFWRALERSINGICKVK